MDESGDGLLNSLAFATVTFNDETRIGAFSDTITEFTANVTSDHSGGVTVHDWRLTGSDDVTIHQSDSPTLKFEVSDTNSTAIITFVLVAHDADGALANVYQFYMSPRPVITIDGGDTLRQVAVGDTFAVPSATCTGGKPAAGFTAQPEPDSIDTSVAAQHTITYTCKAPATDYPLITKTLSVRVGNPGPPGPITVAIESIAASVPERGTISLSGSSTGGNGTPLTYSWSSNPDTAGVFSNTGILNPDFTAPAVDRDTRYTLTLTVNDDRYTASRSVNINVINDPTPVVNIPGPNPLEIEYNGTYTEPAVTCTDNDSATLIPYSDPYTIDTTAPGDTVITFSCGPDSEGQTGTATLTVSVLQPENAPTVTIAGSNPLRVLYNSTGAFTEPAVTCTDYQGNSIDSNTITSSGTIDTSIPASVTPKQTITYTCTDVNGPGAKTLTVIVGERPPTLNQISNPVTTVERTATFTPSDVVECSDDFDDPIRVTHQGLNTRVEGTYPVTFTCTGPTTRLSTELVVDITVTDTQPPEFLSSKYTPGTGVLVVTFNENLDSANTVSPSDFILRSQGETSGGLNLGNATLTMQSQSVTLTLTDEQKEAFKSITNPSLFIEASAVSDTAGNPADSIDDKRVTIAKKRSGSSVPAPVVDLNALQTSQFNVDIPESVLSILESYDPSTAIEPVMEGEITFNFPFVADGACYILGGTTNTIQPHQVGLNQSTELALTAYSSSDIDHFVMFLNLDGDNTSYTLSDTYITYLNGRVTVVDPHNYIADATITIEQDDEQSFQYTIITVIEFDGEMELTNIVARIWNDNSRSTNIRILDALNVVSIPTQSVADTTTDTTSNTTPTTDTTSNTTPTTDTTSNTTPTTELLSTATPATAPVSDADALSNIKMWAGFAQQSVSDSELLASLDLDYASVDIPSWIMTELAVFVVSGDVTIDEFMTALEFVLDTITN